MSLSDEFLRSPSGSAAISSLTTMFPSLFVNGQVFHAPTVSRGSVNISPSLFINDIVFHAATVSIDGSIAVGTLVHDGPATPEQISLWLPTTGTVASTATATCEYKISGAGSYTTGHPLYRVRPAFSTSPAAGGSVADGFAWVILNLSPNTTYDVQVTVTEGASSVVKTLSHTTRALPGDAGAPNKTASSAGAIATQLAGLNAGDVLQIDDGTYAISGLSLTRSGSSGSPIYIRGESRTGTVLTLASIASFFSLGADVSHVIIENMTLEGSGTDQDGNTASSYTTVLSSSDSWTATRITLRNVTATGIDRACYFYDSHEMLVYDNSFTGNNLWETTPTNFLGTNRTWNDDGINLAGEGNCAFNNYMEGFGDTFSYAQHSGNDVTHGGSCIHYYRNEVRNSCDDPIEVDHARRNCTWYDNRVHNCINFDSIDPLYGGPWISARNIMINPYRVNTHKWNDTNTGQFCYNNTYIATVSNGTDADVANWYQPNNGAQRSYGFRNNLHVYRGAGQSIWLESTNHDPIDWTHNAWYPNRQIQWGGTYANLAAAQSGLSSTTPIFSGAQRMANDVITVSNPWVDTITLGASSSVEVTATYFPILSSGDNAKNSGVAIPGITDGYSGAAPDRGAVIEGRSTVIYGDRSNRPSYIAGMSDYDVLQMTSTYSPTNGDEGMDDATPSEWLTSDPGVGLRMVVNAWSGAAKGEGTKLIVNGGGHNDSANNGLYVFDFNGTTKPTGWTVVGQSAVSAVQQAAAYSDGRAAAAHTYDGMYQIGTKIYRFGGVRWSSSGGIVSDAWMFDLDTNAWTQLPNLPHDVSFGPTVCYDPVSDKFLVMSVNNFSYAVYRRSANTWSSSKTYGSNAIANEAATAYDTTRLRGLSIGGGTNRLLTIDWSAETVSSASQTLTGLPTSQAQALFYDPDADRFWAFGGKTSSAGYDNIYEIHPSTFTVTAHSLSASMASFQDSDYQGSFSRFVFMRDWRAIGFVTRTDAAPYVIKLPEV